MGLHDAWPYGMHSSISDKTWDTAWGEYLKPDYVETPSHCTLHTAALDRGQQDAARHDVSTSKQQMSFLATHPAPCPSQWKQPTPSPWQARS